MQDLHGFGQSIRANRLTRQRGLGSYVGSLKTRRAELPAQDSLPCGGSRLQNDFGSCAHCQVPGYLLAGPAHLALNAHEPSGLTEKDACEESQVPRSWLSA